MIRQTTADDKEASLDVATASRIFRFFLTAHQIVSYLIVGAALSCGRHESRIAGPPRRTEANCLPCQNRGHPRSMPMPFPFVTR